MKNLTLKVLSILMASVMLLLPVSVFAERGVTYEVGATLQADYETGTLTAEYEACAFEYTAYIFKPDETGIYTISSDNPLGIISYTGMWATVEPSVNTITANSVTWKCSSVGQKIWVAVYTNGSAATITVEFSPEEIEVKEVINYENKTAPKAFTFNGDAESILFVDTTDDIIAVPVMGPDGVYRLNKQTGPRIYVDIDNEALNLKAATEYGQLRIPIYDDAGEIDYYLDYNNALVEYYDNADASTRYYPLTDDLMEMYQKIGEYKKWYGEGGWIGGLEEDAWMFACCYVEGDTFAPLQADYENGTFTAEYAACAEYTIYTLEPTETGIFTISSDKPLGIISYNGMWATLAPSADTITENSASWTCNSVGQTIWVAVETNNSPATITVEYSPKEIAETKVTKYVNTTAPEAFTLEGDEAAVIYVNTTDKNVDFPVMGPDGIYRLNSAWGPRILVDLDNEDLNLKAITEYGQLRIAVYNDAGEIDYYLDYNDALIEYYNNADASTGYYPLTDDLIEIYQKVGSFKGWYGEEGWIGGLEEDAWMFACCYIEGDIYEDGTETVWPETDTAKLAILSKITFTANGRDTIAITANQENKSVYSFTAWKKGTYTVSLEGTGAKEVWVVNSAGEIVASTDTAVTKAASFDISANAKETYYIVTRSSHTANSTLTVSVNYFSGIKGDVNGDGRLNTRDTIAFKKYSANASTKDEVSLKGLDYDGNGRVNTQDLLKMKRALNPSTGG